jgi:phospholipid/cholesterol/gamma-HCH transport system substrate-binding protein
VKRDNVNYTLVGAVVLVALLTLLGSLYVITGRRGATSDYTVHYRNVTGLDAGKPVFYEGFRIGQVQSVEPERVNNETRYKVSLALRRDWPIPDDSVAALASSGLLADVSVSIREGKSTNLLKAGSEIKSQEGADVFAALNELAGEVTSLTRNHIRPLIETLSTRVDSISANIDTQTPLLLGEAQTLLSKLNAAATAVNDVLGPENRQHIGKTLSGIETVSTDLKSTQQKLDELLVQLNETTAENRPQLRDAVRDLSQVTAAIARRIDGISQRLDSSSRNFDEFTREVRKHPNRLLFTPKADEVIVKEE